MKDLKRDIYKNLLSWKEKNSGKVLEVNGARQVGKTYILTKFARENYESFFYINIIILLNIRQWLLPLSSRLP